ncbi:hypothetical protein KIL84_022549 [Mauremys mutica]|uniref:Uncharacterized protein n=1 Tax=Mauremys mutica TaxID=74926 RepID=A0A9D3WQ08_9SAUR|nr:hypothetical protein KIL84_022549 [Mauremys mutica]
MHHHFKRYILTKIVTAICKQLKCFSFPSESVSDVLNALLLHSLSQLHALEHIEASLWHLYLLVAQLHCTKVRMASGAHSKQHHHFRIFHAIYHPFVDDRTAEESELLYDSICMTDNLHVSGAA